MRYEYTITKEDGEAEIMEKRVIYKENLKSKIKSIKKKIVKDVLKTRYKQTDNFHNFQIFTSHHDYLYSLFTKMCIKNLKKFTILDVPLEIHSYFTDKSYYGGEVWHDHLKTCTICGVLYLVTVNNCGIQFEYDDKIIYVEPKDYDLLIFPGFLKHRPIVSRDKRRVSLNFELSCIEQGKEIFGL